MKGGEKGRHRPKTNGVMTMVRRRRRRWTTDIFG